jgi:hypothetical protein
MFVLSCLYNTQLQGFLYLMNKEVERIVNNREMSWPTLWYYPTIRFDRPREATNSVRAEGLRGLKPRPPE